MISTTVLDVPYVTAAEFRAHPTFLDSENLRTGFNQAAQDAELTNALLKASQWADDEIDMPLRAHIRVENARIKPDAFGQLRYHPEHAPVIAVTAIAIGADPTQLSTVTGPTTWTEQDGRIVVAALGAASPGLRSIQFGSGPAAPYRQLVQWTYLAGFPATQLAANAAAAATQVSVLDATGISAGSVLRIWTPAAEEAVTVSGVSGTNLTLSAGLRNAHSAGDTFSALPTTARDAVINAAIASLLRPGPQAEANAPAGVPSPSASSKDKGRTSGGVDYMAKACHLLRNYRRIR